MGGRLKHTLHHKGQDRLHLKGMQPLSKVKEDFCQKLFTCSEYHIIAIQNAYGMAVVHIPASVGHALKPI